MNNQEIKEKAKMLFMYKCQRYAPRLKAMMIKKLKREVTGL